ncbi:MAG: GNAT family N-acetyltransferase [Myxococcaceae bacterium]|nr:GNAT family N-acetyltransferase [Myxococcaceae bacterium]
MQSIYTVTAVQHRAELEQILALQRENLKQALSAEEMRSQGFVTLQHDLAALEQMHALAPSIIARQGEELVGYALTMPRECRALMPVLVPMFELFDRLDYRGRPLKDYRFYVMGQIAIAKAHRGRGLFELLYDKHRELYQHQFDFVITEVSASNHRSLRAHERVGFQTVHTYRDATDEWAVVAWDWSPPRLTPPR